MFETKTTTNERWPQNIKSCISQQLLIRSSSNFKLKLIELNQNHKCLRGRGPPMEEDLKILKDEYLRNHWPDLPQIWNLSSGDQTKIKIKAWKEEDHRGRVEEDLKILKVEYLSKHWSDLSQILNLCSEDQTKIKNSWN